MLKDVARSVVSRGTWNALKTLKAEVRLTLAHGAGTRAAKRYAGRTDLKIHLGCGYNPKPGWVNVDLFNDRADLSVDLRERWPFADGSADIIYSEHVFEHFEVPVETDHLLAEARRILKPGGVFSVGVPDTEWPILAYADKSDLYWKHCWEGHDGLEAFHPPECRTRLDSLNYHFRQAGEHKYAWDEETLTNALQRAGFVDVRKRDFDPALDYDRRRVGTLYMTGTRPTA